MTQKSKRFKRLSPHPTVWSVKPVIGYDITFAPHTNISDLPSNLEANHFVHLNFLLGHPLLSLFLKFRSPSCQWWPSIDNIANTPQHPLLVSLLADIVVRTDNVELILLHLLHHKVCDLTGRPCAVRLLDGLAGYVSRLERC